MDIPIDRESSTIDVTLQLKEEQLVLAKKWIQTGEVKIYRESFTEEKNFTLTVEYEELVIEKKLPFSATPEQNEPPDVIRIRLSEEQVEFTKRMVSLEDVSIYKQQIEEIQHIEETLRREESAIKILGSPILRDDQN
ncbi:YsnF/AvaK domain-containing protein [Desulfosporosinus lacus]|uniref:Conserved domain-containing protein n=1 Tax=Desulfosporosinus lacus DSM 15449 TaxID=1121420 RepID=A0A1M6FV27_9FIRM|nr:YsnF/AvaK domain-containing protein [Desulfosporosinus lacus]SHJ01555.1 conserved domain-containing protein [Desulfosporosinus lacus DSM 15449]